MKKLLFCALMLMLPIVARADTSTPTERFTAANQYFEKGDTEKAFEIYQALVSQGFESPELYYNLGNLHYRRGERGKAVLWYERALRLNPRDPDILYNLALARSHIRDADEDIFRRIFSTFTGNELSVALSLLIWIFFGVLGMRIFGRIGSDGWPRVVLWLCGFLLVFVTGWFGVAVALEQQPRGVVTMPPGEVRNGPGDYPVAFTIPEGSDVLILNRRPDWTQVGVADQGLKGWMPNSEVEPVQITSVSN